MVLQGRVVVGDAMFCQRELCQQVVESGGDDLFAVKDNQPTLLREISLAIRTNSSVPKKAPCPREGSMIASWIAITPAPSIKDMAVSNVGL